MQKDTGLSHDSPAISLPLGPESAIAWNYLRSVHNQKGWKKKKPHGPAN